MDRPAARSADRTNITVIGAGVVGMAVANSLLHESFAVTVVDTSNPGEGCFFGNAGALSPGSVAPLAAPVRVCTCRNGLPIWPRSADPRTIDGRVGRALHHILRRRAEWRLGRGDVDIAIREMPKTPLRGTGVGVRGAEHELAIGIDAKDLRSLGFFPPHAGELSVKVESRGVVPAMGIVALGYEEATALTGL